ncbi:unnamed protein product [Soboliphyme baturini]|uniref:Mrr_cat domain-containing protein n=1 Tax=Soboliphyme baturini TaxID=241478 RepID=A0A183J277_9BILA|nr:unnamed protein product [Soboliphyme baturini]
MSDDEEPPPQWTDDKRPTESGVGNWIDSLAGSRFGVVVTGPNYINHRSARKRASFLDFVGNGWRRHRR